MTPAPGRLAAWLGLEDGSVFEGVSFGAAGDARGEVVFNTSMAGYQEVLTDPSYKGQMVVMTVAHVGNCGVNPEDAESDRPHVEGFIVREACAVPSNWRSRESLPDYLARHGVAGIEGIDTRALVALLREKGALRGVIMAREKRPKDIVERARAVARIEDRDLVGGVACARARVWAEDGDRHVVVVDCGVKRNILRALAANGCRVTVVPPSETSAGIMARKPDGVLFSNGPGDPEKVPEVARTARALIGKLPVFGICLGHQIIGLASGGKTFKLKFGHHGGNHPVQDLKSTGVAITVQNHNFALEAGSLPPEFEVTHLNLNDRTVEGVRHRKLPVFSVQYHPEACPGPHDATGHFREFVEMMGGGGS